MDFRIPQEGETRFMYCLPMSKNTALVEATAFSNNILTEAEYGEMITNYLNNYLNINSFTIKHKEMGVIPMTTYNFAQHHEKHVIQIGTMGGDVKPSTGYAFVRIQENAQKIMAFAGIVWKSILWSMLQPIPRKVVSIRMNFDVAL